MATRHIFAFVHPFGTDYVAQSPRAIEKAVMTRSHAVLHSAGPNGHFGNTGLHSEGSINMLIVVAIEVQLSLHAYICTVTESHQNACAMLCDAMLDFRKSQCQPSASSTRRSQR